MSQSPNPGIRSFLLINLALKAPALTMEIRYEKWKETRLDNRPSSRAKDDGEKENAGCKNS